MPVIAELAQSIDPANGLPLYLQLQQALREAIRRGGLGAGSALPPERRLATELKLARITVRKAIDGLVQEGLLVRRHGAGNFVGPRIEKSVAALTSFSEDMRLRGRTPSSRWIARSAGLATPEEAMRLGLSPGAPVQRCTRLRLADGAPMALEICTIAGDALPSMDAVDASLYDTLAKLGRRPVRALQRLRALLLDERQAKLLDAPAGAAGLLVERVGYLRDGRAIEWSRSYYRGDTYDFVAELNAD